MTLTLSGDNKQFDLWIFDVHLSHHVILTFWRHNKYLTFSHLLDWSLLISTCLDIKKNYFTLSLNFMMKLHDKYFEALGGRLRSGVVIFTLSGYMPGIRMSRKWCSATSLATSPATSLMESLATSPATSTGKASPPCDTAGTASIVTTMTTTTHNRHSDVADDILRVP